VIAESLPTIEGRMGNAGQILAGVYRSRTISRSRLLIGGGRPNGLDLFDVGLDDAINVVENLELDDFFARQLEQFTLGLGEADFDVLGF
jgi:hypothetical protein